VTRGLVIMSYETEPYGLGFKVKIQEASHSLGKEAVSWVTPRNN